MVTAGKIDVQLLRKTIKLLLIKLEFYSFTIYSKNYYCIHNLTNLNSQQFIVHFKTNNAHINPMNTLVFFISSYICNAIYFI